MKYLSLLLVLSLTACGAATSSITPRELGVSARDAYLEARSAAYSWDDAARLRWVEGTGITRGGLALPDAGYWRFHYTAPGHSQGLVVTVSSLEMSQEERAPSSPPGYVIGDNAIGGSWLDSREVADDAFAAREAAGGLAADVASMMLVPIEPPQWVVTFDEGEPRRVRLDAATGTVVR